MTLWISLTIRSITGSDPSGVILVIHRYTPHQDRMRRSFPDRPFRLPVPNTTGDFRAAPPTKPTDVREALPPDRLGQPGNTTQLRGDHVRHRRPLRSSTSKASTLSQDVRQTHSTVTAGVVMFAESLYQKVQQPVGPNRSRQC